MKLDKNWEEERDIWFAGQTRERRLTERSEAFVSHSRAPARPHRPARPPCHHVRRGRDSSADARCPVQLVRPMGYHRTVFAGLAAVDLSQKASEAAYFRQQYKNTRACPKGR